jgi:hypothetical protein
MSGYLDILPICSSCEKTLQITILSRVCSASRGSFSVSFSVSVSVSVRISVTVSY